MSTGASEVRVFGIRHHGPGSARSLRRALDEFAPDAVLVELPADCQAALEWVGHAELCPPVALLGYVVDRPHRAAFVPFAEFSPEWQAATWAVRRRAALRAIDVPLTTMLAGGAAGEQAPESALDLGDVAPADPIAALAAAAGDPDPERWWDDVVEHRGDGTPAFDAVALAMHAVRPHRGAASVFEERREAHMRRALRQACGGGFERIAVVCGAWHVPALSEPLPPTSVDAATLRGLPKVKVGVSWVPWTHRRLATSTGYGAGVSSPGWYAHVFAHPGEEGVARWFVRLARLLRERDLPASPDHLIAAIRGAEALAALRGRPRPGLAEVLDAAETVMAGGLTAAGSPMVLVHDRLVVGDVIGTVPDEAPQVPLARDLAAQQRKVRMRPEALARSVELDLRTPNGLARSVLLHRVHALEVAWGQIVEGRGSSGTFRETWIVQWEPELTIRVIELAAHGTTVRAAAANRLLERADATSAIAELVQVLDDALLGDLPEVVEPVARRLAERAAHDPDIADLADALGPLARSLRYGDVRATDASSLRAVFDGLVVRILAGLPGACRSLGDDAAAAMVERLTEVQAALAQCDHPARRAEWPGVLAAACVHPHVHGLVQGRAARLLHDGGTWQRDEVERRLSRALSVGTRPAAGAAFVEGFLAGSGTVLVHDTDLLAVVDRWLSALAADAFVAAVPLLRRTFGAFDPAERRQLGRLVTHRDAAEAVGVGEGLDPDRVAAAVDTVRLLLGAPV